jgi:hypothetical protein
MHFSIYFHLNYSLIPVHGELLKIAVPLLLWVQLVAQFFTALKAIETHLPAIREDSQALLPQLDKIQQLQELISLLGVACSQFVIAL